MSISQAYRGVTYIVPETDEEDWGDQGTTQLVALLAGGNETEFTSAASNVVKKAIVGADLTISAGGTITWVKNHHVVLGNAAAVTVDATTGISAGESDKQLLTLEGGHATNTVQLDHAGNCNLNGAVVLGLGHTITLRWSVVDTEWVEQHRSH